MTETTRKMAVEMKMAAVLLHAVAFFEHDLDLRERLDGMIRGQVKYLFQLKAMQTNASSNLRRAKRITTKNCRECCLNNR